MEFVCYKHWDKLPDSANALFAQAEKDSVFFARPWFENLVENALKPDQKMLLACVQEHDQVRALLPLMTDGSETLQSLRSIYTSLSTLLLGHADQAAVLRCLAQGLQQLPFTYVRLEPLAEDDQAVEALQQAMESEGYDCQRYFKFFNWIHRLQGQTSAEYFAARPGMLRSTIKRKKRKLEREHGYDIRLYTGGDLQQAVADYTAMYDASWKVREPFADMIGGLAGSMATQGWLRLAILYVDGKPAAGQFWFVVHGRANIFRLAYDEAWKAYSVGSILTEYLMRYVIDTDMVQEIDFLTGNERYKQDWMSQRRERQGLVCMVKAKPKGVIGRFVAWLTK